MFTSPFDLEEIFPRHAHCISRHRGRKGEKTKDGFGSFFIFALKRVFAVILPYNFFVKVTSLQFGHLLKMSRCSRKLVSDAEIKT